VPLIKGHLSPDESERLRSHIETCPNCRREFEEYAWLIAGMVSAREEIQNGHVSSGLLFQFVQKPRSLDSETMEFVNAHLDQCEHCRQDFFAIQELSDIDIAGTNPAAETAPEQFSFWRSLFRRRLLPVHAALAVVVLAVIVWLNMSDKTSPFEIARAVTKSEALSSGYSIVALSSSMTTRGDDALGTAAPEIDRTVKHEPIILNLEAVTFEDEDMTYSVTITAADGNVVWQSTLSVDQLESGKVWLIFDPKDMKPGSYQVSVVEHQSGYQATVSTAHFQIAES
jgi:hypothetical protein